ncbi:class I SAM-dependent methyltransferase [Streptococcus massiliensis]|uniref:Adenine-specific DNA methylase n=1 Tax=Streptococcus massiliensis TaxID=313439 RepID=A0A380KZ76_9STRE|nr:class I SAM-dependent methyltransferase [Streptococcus massiliensis]SUN76407.1 adenine-specific DNA methylase [Streptococcus massiliensis]
MNFEKIEQAYALLLENIQNLQNILGTSFYDALIEQNGLYLNPNSNASFVDKNNQKLRQLALSKEEWRRSFQFLLIKANQTEPLQANHQFTPDAIGFLLVFILEELTVDQELDLLEFGSGTGNLAETILNHSKKKIDYLGLELDDLLIDLSASIADVMDSQAHFIQGDAVRPQVLKESDVIISDLPVGYYPDDVIARRFEVASRDEHSYAHHLMMEQSFKYLKKDGYAIFLAPNDLLTSPQSDLLKAWLNQRAQLVAMIALPENLFASSKQAKSIFVLQKQQEQAIETFVYPLSNLQDKEEILKFSQSFQNWLQN